jgi:hypothetical protein
MDMPLPHRPPARPTHSRRRATCRTLRPALLALLPLLTAVGACRDRAAAPPAAASATPDPAAERATVNTRPEPGWVKVYDPAAAWNGYTLTLIDLRKPALLDMNGRVVHEWPDVRMHYRVRLLPDGSVLGIGLGRRLVEHDWNGRLTWQYTTPNALPHHDVIRLANGNTLALLLVDGEKGDTVVEVDRAGTVVWTWKALDHVQAFLPERPSQPNDLTHINSIQELPDNPLHRAGDERFRPGNLLMSARNLDRVILVDRTSGEVVWSYAEGLDRQHEALMAGPEMPRPGTISIFNNRRGSFMTDRQSEVLEIDPRNETVTFRYREPGFYSETIGTQQPLPNGNFLVTSTRGGRVFEVTPERRIVWQWVPPHYEPVRALRVAPDACPQLAAMAPPPSTPVAAPAGYRHVDPNVYQFARRGSRTNVRVEGTKRSVLEATRDCRDLLLPMDPQVAVGYGVDRRRLRAAGREQRPPEFVLRLEPEGGEPTVLLRDSIGADGPWWRQQTISLAPHGTRPVRLCVEVDGGAPQEGAQGRFAWWEQPVISPVGGGAALVGEDGDNVEVPGADFTPEELEERRKHLEALGYVG